MRRIGIPVGIVGVVLALASIVPVLSAAAERPGRERRPGRPEGVETPAGQRPQVQRLRQHAEELRAAGDELIAQLRVIHQSATHEKATATASQIEALISSCEETIQNLIQQIESPPRRPAQPPSRAGLAPPQGKPAPVFELKDFGGASYKLSDYKDRLVVLEWFNFECPFSIYHYQTTPTMVNLAQKYRDQGVTFLSVNSTSHTTPDANLGFIKKHALRHPILDDRPGTVGRKYGARTTPHMYIIDRGVIVYEGAIDNAPLGKPPAGAEKINYVEKALAELLAGRPVSTPNTPPYGCTVKYP